MCAHGFILIELLIVISICSLTMALFWQSINNRMKMLVILEKKYAMIRLESDLAILEQINKSAEIDPKDYLPLILNVTDNKIKIDGKNIKLKKF